MSAMKLIHGTFSQQDAQNLLTGLTKAKIAFHENKIRTVHLSEEDIKHSEQKIIQLGNNLRKMIDDIKSHPGCNVAIDTDIAMTILNN
jgi:hypothetical protein